MFYCYRRLLVPRFTYTRCETIPCKVLSLAGQTMAEQIILGIDAMIIAGTMGSCITAGIAYRFERGKNKLRLGQITDTELWSDEITGISLIIATAGIYYYLCCAGTAYCFLRAGSRLYRNEMYLVKNKI
jgi:hypothetical protein